MILYLLRELHCRCEVGNAGRGWIASMSHLANWLSLHKDFAHENVRICKFIINLYEHTCIEFIINIVVFAIF